MKFFKVPILILSLLIHPLAFCQDYWTLDPAENENPLLNLRYLNEKSAGQSGFVHLSDDGDDFMLGDGTPARFWAVQTGVGSFKEEVAGQEHARWLARLGVNLARLGGGTLNSREKGSQIDDVREEALDQTWRGVAALKKEGIYSLLMPYWVAKGSDVTNWGIEGYSGRSGGATNGLWGLLFFNQDLQKAYKSWIKRLLTEPNPYTGIPLCDEPAVAVILLQNEDSLLFWTMPKIAEPQKRILGEKFAQWASVQYGSPEKALEAWGGQTIEGDDLEEGRFAFYHIYDATLELPGPKARRVNDQVRFFTETMRNFNLEMMDYVKNDLGCKQLVAAENWKTASPERLLDLERYAYTACDVIAKNHYFSAPHVAKRFKTRVNKGDLFAPRSVLKEPWAFPLNTRQVDGHPNIITESTWVEPNIYKSEGPFLVAAYRSLIGQDAFFWFAVGGSNGFGVNNHKWNAAQPMIAGQWPAAALLYRQGYVREAAPVIHEERPLESLYKREVPEIVEDEGFDIVRDEETGEVVCDVNLKALAYLVGRVEVVYGGNPENPRMADLSDYIDIDKKTVRSLTDEIRLDYGQGVCTLDTPKAQGACGFLGETGEVSLSDISIKTQNPYISILLVSMDGLELTASKRLLLQIGTTAYPSGWETKPAEVKTKKMESPIPGLEIVNFGKAPWVVEAAVGSMEINNPHLDKALILDSEGALQREDKIQKESGKIRLALPPDTLYVILESSE